MHKVNTLFVHVINRWLLMGRSAITLAVNTFFYDPFSSTTINLPPFQAPWYIKPDLDADRFTLRLDFSAPPTSA